MVTFGELFRMGFVDPTTEVVVEDVWFTALGALSIHFVVLIECVGNVDGVVYRPVFNKTWMSKGTRRVD